ncbi:MAG TPA: hypothetical protein VEK12_02185 [Alphaproteobacteria bacterium]|nr:hypothetical protein [Alphaproteobacteria bacterium]
MAALGLGVLDQSPVRDAEAYGVDEILVLTICHEPEARRHFYRLTAEALGLPPRAG